MARPKRIDHTTMKVDGVAPPGSEESGGVAENRWWTQDPDEAAGTITSILGVLREHDEARLKQYRAAAALWGNSMLFGAGGHVSTAMMDFGAPLCGFNVVQSVGATVASRIAKNKPRAMYVTTGGDYAEKRRAQKLNRYTDGICYEVDAHEKEVRAFIDAYVLGDGFLHFHERGGRIAWTRVPPFELHIDELEGRRGDPRQLHWVRHVDRSVLLAAYPDKLDIIKEAGMDPAAEPAWSHVADLVTVRESWHLPSGPKATDGRRLVSVENHALSDMEPWGDEFFPFERMRWEPRLEGWWSQGAAEQIRGIQIEIQKIALVIQKALHLFGTPKVFLENGAKIPTAHLNNDIGIVMRGEKPPVYMSPPVVQAEIYGYYESKKGEAFAQLGMSQFAASGTLPQGMQNASGEAQRVFNAIESDRFMLLGQEYERFHMACVRQSVAQVRRIIARGDKYPVRVPGPDARRLDWDDVNLDDSAAILQAFPVSSLPNEPAGRMQTLNEWQSKGWVNARQARRLGDMPDLEAADALATAAETACEKVMDAMVDEGRYTPPDPLDDLDLHQTTALEYYEFGKANDLAEERLDLLRNYLSDIRELKKRALREAMDEQQLMAKELAEKNAGPAPLQPPGSPEQQVPPPAGFLPPSAQPQMQ